MRLIIHLFVLSLQPADNLEDHVAAHSLSKMFFLFFFLHKLWNSISGPFYSAVHISIHIYCLFVSHLVGHSINVRPGIIDGEFRCVVGLTDDVEVSLVVSIALAAHSHQGLATAHYHCPLILVEPWQHLHVHRIVAQTACSLCISDMSFIRYYRCRKDLRSKLTGIRQRERNVATRRRSSSVVWNGTTRMVG